ncbi:uncharacterized protein [Blastocystis hominis]|uniref:CSD domain-containing protein n=1 Tax=Blastocystis hominis TaxID=12968 RepID=D8M2C4_BLAHO|nr:uncharacterized protein [Blastocystis hominis]CBK22219.2 unnamed protein product [Blastocystis hominis]|eukprot:XP_012896267.1 uncharacterized protein [Blastocystis hominis]
MSRTRKQYTVCEAISPDKDRIKGVVKWYDGYMGYGFISTLDETPVDYFVHKTQIYSLDKFPRTPILFNKEEVEFAVCDTEKGKAAEEVSLPDKTIIPKYCVLMSFILPLETLEETLLSSQSRPCQW